MPEKKELNSILVLHEGDDAGHSAKHLIAECMPDIYLIGKAWDGHNLLPEWFDMKVDMVILISETDHSLLSIIAGDIRNIISDVPFVLATNRAINKDSKDSIKSVFDGVILASNTERLVYNINVIWQNNINMKRIKEHEITLKALRDKVLRYEHMINGTSQKSL